jgi:hypothetical protein
MVLVQDASSHPLSLSPAPDTLHEHISPARGTGGPPPPQVGHFAARILIHMDRLARDTIIGLSPLLLDFSIINHPWHPPIPSSMRRSPSVGSTGSSPSFSPLPPCPKKGILRLSLLLRAHSPAESMYAPISVRTHPLRPRLLHFLFPTSTKPTYGLPFGEHHPSSPHTPSFLSAVFPFLISFGY